MKRVHWHWTAGAPGMIQIEADSYHEIIQPDGTVQRGQFPVEANIPPLRPGQYAAHTLNANSHAIGIACDAMAGAQERPLDWGSNPLTEAQVEAMLDRTAYYCRRYGIPVSRQTTLSHAEVQANLGIAQRNKWDFMVLPGMTRVDDPVVVGDELRRRLTLKLKALDAPPVLTAPPPFAGLVIAVTAALRRIFGKG
ncbi:peptidoglycan recognition protein family protein [Falsirhodobacter halotolerans]|uniref:peptidoglycan recognition protein family protein n=1 Tax=Falsirhodobacter halotolerans TaxID=1146892 RepID=UPI001FD0CF82|nr:N-acetylmuramoyl-L-alanine amidase [Falsirhodobacter halotolerans]MCJ8139335.1 N-acetylmuramoyl-L-alanine amidase [Falsirhodobacter halotolerans]